MTADEQALSYLRHREERAAKEVVRLTRELKQLRDSLACDRAEIAVISRRLAARTPPTHD